MIATPVLNRAHDGSRGSRTTSPHQTINKTTTAHTNPSPVADGKWGGGGDQNRALGASRGSLPAQPDALPRNEPDPAPPIPTLPEGKNLSRFLDAFLDGSFSIPSICDEFELTLYEVLALLESTEVQNALETLKKIATIRQDTIAIQARVTAIHRLSELATYAHTADAVEARAFETARKSAAQIIRITNPNRRPQALAAESARKFRDRTSPPRERRDRVPVLCACAQGSSICRAVGSELRRRKRDSSESYPTEEIGSEIRPTKTPTAGPLSDGPYRLNADATLVRASPTVAMCAAVRSGCMGRQKILSQSVSATGGWSFTNDANAG